jgi:hypothetical protein
MRAASLLVSRQVRHLLRAFGHICHCCPGLRLVVLCGLISAVIGGCSPPPVPPLYRTTPPPSTDSGCEQQAALRESGHGSMRSATSLPVCGALTSPA